jgi:PHAX RNA-binding domain
MGEEDPVTQTMIVLGEMLPGPRAQIRSLIAHCGLAQVQEWIARAREIEADGGMLMKDGQGTRRTFGGVFFAVAKEAITDPKRRREIFVSGDTERYRRKKRNARASPTSSPPGERWEDRGAWIKSGERGEATTVKVTIVGRPGNPVERQGFTLVRMIQTPTLDNLPKGLPIPAQSPATPSVLYIGGKQWRKVAEAIRNPEDVLICEGVQFWDAQYQVLTVFCTTCTTKLLQKAQRPTPPPPPPSS